MWRFLIRFLSAIAVLKIGLASIQYSVHKKLPEAKHPRNNWQPRLPANLPQPPVESRNPIGIVPVPSLSVRSVVTKSPLSFWSANCHSNVWSVRSLKTSRLTCVSSPAPSWLFKNLQQLPSIPWRGKVDGGCSTETFSIIFLAEKMMDLTNVEFESSTTGTGLFLYHYRLFTKVSFLKNIVALKRASKSRANQLKV